MHPASSQATVLGPFSAAVCTEHSLDRLSWHLRPPPWFMAAATADITNPLLSSLLWIRADISGPERSPCALPCSLPRQDPNCSQDESLDILAECPRLCRTHRADGVLAGADLCLLRMSCGMHSGQRPKHRLTSKGGLARASGRQTRGLSSSWGWASSCPQASQSHPGPGVGSGWV